MLLVDELQKAILHRREARVARDAGRGRPGEWESADRAVQLARRALLDFESAHYRELFARVGEG